MSAFKRYQETLSNSYGDVYGKRNPWVRWLRKHHPRVLKMPIGKFKGFTSPREAK